MEHLLDLPMKIAHALVALAVLFMAWGGKGPPSAPSAQLAFPFMEEARRRDPEYAKATPYSAFAARALLTGKHERKRYEV